MVAVHALFENIRRGSSSSQYAGDSGSFEWPGLHRRLAAAHAARRALLETGSLRNVPQGAFAQLTASVSVAANASTRVNLTGLADGKAAYPRAAAGAEHLKVGDWGQ